MVPNFSSAVLFGPFTAEGRIVKCIGLMGGDGTDSAVLYRCRLEQEIAQRWGRRYVQNIVTMDLRIDQLTAAMQARDWKTMVEQIRFAADRLASHGARRIVLCSSMLHIGADRLNLKVPLLHIADATLAAVLRSGVKRVGLLGTRYREEDLFWRAHFERANLPDVFVPTEKDRQKVTRIIVDELWRGIVRVSSSIELMRVIYSLRQAGAQAVVLAVPELALALADTESVLPLYNSGECHVAAALKWACIPASSGAPQQIPVNAPRDNSTGKRDI
jgi:aspartate racemase